MCLGMKSTKMEEDDKSKEGGSREECGGKRTCWAKRERKRRMKAWRPELSLDFW